MKGRSARRKTRSELRQVLLEPSGSTDADGSPRIGHGEEFYGQPRWYDLVHAEGTSDDIDLLIRLNDVHGTGGKRWLEPACGTGRYLFELARRGYVVTGYDINPAALTFAQNRLRRYGRSARAVRGNMTSFVRRGKYDLVYNLINTFRHLLTEEDAHAHLKCVADSLKPGGLYVIGLDLLDYHLPEPAEAVWRARRGKTTASHVMMSIPPERRSCSTQIASTNEAERRERIINFLTVSRPGQTDLFMQSTYDLRTYNLGEFLKLVGSSPLQLQAVYSPCGRPSVLGEKTRDVIAVLITRQSHAG